MINLAKYQILELIFNEGKTSVYRARREWDGRLVIIKLLSIEYPNLQDIARIKHEYEILSSLNISGIIQAYSIEKYNNSFALILENIDGVSLAQIIKTEKIELQDFLQIALQIAQALGELHQNQVIHKDIKPLNLVINWSSRLVKIIDFSLSSRLSKEKPQLDNSRLIEGTLAYISPEQTGRMNRLVDYRTDFYSLGVTFYEMLTGRLPFNATDPMELVHCHIAKQPISILELKPDTPPAISAIVMKLLSKTAEDRYQSAFGLKADLESCMHQLESTGYIWANFAIGQQDKSGQLEIPEKLYGREHEINTLLTAFAQVSQGSKELILVAGYSGIGKSALVNEVHKPIVEKRGYFIFGKFEQFNRNIPYASLIQAFQELVRQLLTESIEQLAVWREKLLVALTSNAQIIIDVIPEIELIIGKQPDVPELGPAESQNRFNLVFVRFIGVFAQQTHPLVIFLDDLQWADLASLKMIQLLITDNEIANLFIIGAYRNNEVSASHPLMLILQEIARANIAIKTINCQPLQLKDVEEIIIDTLKCEFGKAKLLAELIFNKTAGNPFFFTQLLKYIHQEGLLVYNFGTGKWEWDIEQIRRIEITDNVVELMLNNIQKLQPNTQNILKLAACIGNRFNLDMLAVINEKSQKDTAYELWEALKVGLILPLDETYKLPQLVEDLNDLLIDYKFLHDRVQQAAYALIPNAQKQEVHLKIGQLLLQNLDENLVEEKIFDIVNQLNIGSDLIITESERYKLAQLNLLAGKKAKDSTAYESAVKFFRLGLSMLAIDSWATNYELTLALHVETVETEYLNANFEQAEILFESVIANSQDILDTVKVYEKKIQFYVSQNRMREAVDIGLQIFAMLGMTLSQNVPPDLKIEDLANRPVMTEANKLAGMRILMTVIPPAYFAAPALFYVIIFTMVNLCFDYGNSPFAAYAYVCYGLILCGSLTDIELGYQFGELSLKLLEQFNARELKSKIYGLFNIFVRHWKEHIQETISPIQEGLQIALEIGDIEYAGYNGILFGWHLFFTGENLESLEERLAPCVKIAQNIKQDHFTFCLQILRQLLYNLVVGVEYNCNLEGEFFNDSTMQTLIGNSTATFYAYVAKIVLSYFLGDYAQSVKNAQLAEPHTDAVIGSTFLSQHNFYYSLALLAMYPHQTSDSTLEIVEINQKKMQKWAFHSPANYQHKYELVEAEKARVLGQHIEAMEYYDRAIQGAHNFAYIQEEALAYERAAEFYLSLGRKQFASLYMKIAYYGYMRWGAKAKGQDLELRYPDLINNFSTNNQTEFNNISITVFSTNVTDKLDLTTVIKASQTLSEEIRLDNLLQKLMEILVENAGAETGYLILSKAGNLFIEAKRSANKSEVMSHQVINNDSCEYLPISVIRYVEKTRIDLVVSNAVEQGIFVTDSYIKANKVKSILCTPIIYQGKLLAIVYLENSLTVGAFTADRLQVLKLLSSQIAISLENAQLYANLEEKVVARTIELNENNQQLTETLDKLKLTQAQLIQTEKMSSLGQVVAGVAHEINNPITFIYGNMNFMDDYIHDLFKLIDLYQKTYPNTIPEINTFLEEIDVDFMRNDMSKIISSVKSGTDRIREIVLTLRNFSRLDEADMKPVNIHEGIDSTLLILQSRLQSKPDCPAIKIIKDYADLPKVECYPGQLNQVFMNILINAIEALDRCNHQRTKIEINQNPSIIIISTKITNSDTVSISIKDNALGMDAEVKQKIFDPFFTTKSVGEGTGLGLSISYQIIVDKHNGKIECTSALGEGTEFVIQIPLKQVIQSS